MIEIRKYGLSLILTLASLLTANAQKVALKTNLLYDATTTPNLGAELAMGKKSTLQLFYGLNPWKFASDRTKQLRHWLLMPEYRYWTCQKFNGHFFGIHALGGQYNVGGIDLPNPVFKDLDEKRYEGWYAGGGLTYGYQWLLSRHWNLEASVGVGYIRFHYKEFPCTECGALIQENNKNYFGPTKLALSLMYCF
ncbi:MAG: DUF3575 domain-containing protein [Bacteroidales bacterium]|nr:DUF3575 domain-containing protein [Prevotella sp.]MDD6731637.1 DUF3575 domain-containing protein [Bacteroidales bacterium]